jgi:hypothetical protein
MLVIRTQRERACIQLCVLPWLVGTALLVLAASGCRETDNVPGEEMRAPSKDLSAAVPVPGRHLDRARSEDGGLFTMLGPDGLPVRRGPAPDPLVLEALRFYDTLGSPGLAPQSLDYPDPITGAPPGPRPSAPLTFAAWKSTFGFPPQEPGESLEAYRRRLGIAVYYNRNELGLGRELGCAEFLDGQDEFGQPRNGVACFVSNYGAHFRDENPSLTLALLGAAPRNTVCITYRPSMPEGYQVQFYTYGPDHTRQEWAQLDTLGPRPHPHVCMDCHGGSYDSEKHLARGARFLPLNPNLVVFSADPATFRDRATQEEAIRRVNAMALRTPLTDAQRELIDRLYLGLVETPGTPSQPSWAPAAWSASPLDREFYAKVVDPYCSTCHLAIETGRNGPSLSHRLFASPSQFRGFPMPSFVCGSFSMPNAQPTMLGFWDKTRGPVTIGDKSHASAADALLDVFGMGRNQCDRLDEVSSCYRGPDPEALCGNVRSGLACNRLTGRCVPDVAAPGAAVDPIRGYCRSDGSRTCPNGLVCETGIPALAGLESYDGICVTPPP